jgi:hypothetical protein
MGYRWPPSWWPLSSLSPLVAGEVEEAGGKLCPRCERPPFLGRLLNVGNDQFVCVDCFAFVTGIDDRDPIEDPTARSGDPRYIARSERDDAPPFEPFPPPEDERPPLAPLPPGTPWWVRFLHWLGVRGATIR